MDGARFCGQCGAALAGGERFCGSCGAPTPGSRPAAPPPAPDQPPLAAAPARRGGFPVKRVLLLIVLIPVVLVGGTIAAVRAGVVEQEAVLSLIGRAPPTVTVMNLRDDAVRVTVLAAATKSTYEEKLAGFGSSASLTPLDPGAYTLSFFVGTAATPALGTCRLTVRQNDHYDFAILPNGVALDRANDHAKAARDFALATSSLCK